MPVALDTLTAKPAPTAAIILAAGRSTRMRSRLPKPLHPICGYPMTTHVVNACRNAGVSRIVVVVGHEAQAVMDGLGSDLEFALQQTPRGTADAVMAARQHFEGWAGTILILAGDIPLIPATTLAALLQKQVAGGAAATMLTSHLDDPTGYGRIVRDADGSVIGIVEHKDATPEQLAITEWNPSIYAFSSDHLWTALDKIEPTNAQGEYYLTDAVSILRRSGQKIEALPASSSNDVLGVNTRVELAAAAALLRKRILTAHMLEGVSITDPENTYIEADVQIGMDTVVEPNSYLYNGTRIGENCVIGPMVRLSGTTIGDNTRIWSSQAVQATIGSNVSVGPFANLRPGTQLANKVKIGDFVEVKNASFGEGAQASHLAYIGDAEVGAGSNIGAGVITCNYDGFLKHRTVIGKNVFVGSNSTLIAPVTISDGAFIAAGSPITVNVPSDALAIARCRTVLKEGWAANYRAVKLVEKEATRR